MAGSRWEDRFKRYPASVPLPAEDGITTSRRRGEMADTWWSKRFVGVLESYGLGSRMQRGRRYARGGQVISLDVTPGLLVSQVQGSRRRPYVVTIVAPRPTTAQWETLEDVFRSCVGFAARLLAGEVPEDLDAAFASAGVELIPSRWDDLGASCTCPDWENPCKHIAAVMYLFADQLDRDPWLLLTWRGRTRDELLAHLRHDPTTGKLPPWWPLSPARTLAAHAVPLPGADAPDPPDRVLRRLPALEVDVRGVSVGDLLGVAYRQIYR
jgi:hypothetical protein